MSTEAIILAGLDRDTGSVMVLHGWDAAGAEVLVGVDRRSALAILIAIEEDGPQPAAVEHWQVLSRVRKH